MKRRVGPKRSYFKSLVLLVLLCAAAYIFSTTEYKDRALAVAENLFVSVEKTRDMGVTLNDHYQNHQFAKAQKMLEGDGAINN